MNFVLTSSVNLPLPSKPENPFRLALKIKFLVLGLMNPMNNLACVFRLSIWSLKAYQTRLKTLVPRLSLLFRRPPNKLVKFDLLMSWNSKIDFVSADLTSEKRDQYVTLTRYCLYLGLCVTVCIIFQNSTWLAALFGIVVGIYISMSEYWLKTNPAPKTPSQKILEAAMGME